MRLIQRHFVPPDAVVFDSTASGPRALDDEAREAAAAVGLRVIRSRRRSPPGVDGGYMVVEPTLHVPVFGTGYEKTAREVIDFCLSVQ